MRTSERKSIALINGKTIAAGTLAVCVGLGGAQAMGASGTWSATPAGSAWENASNWVGGTIPGATTGQDTANTDAATFSSTDNLTVTPDQNRVVKDVTFSSTAGAYVIGGTNMLSVAAGGTISGGNTSTITFNAPIYFGGDYNIKPATGQTFDFNGTVTQHAGRSFQIGSGNLGIINFNGVIASSGQEVSGIPNGNPATGNPVNVRWLGGGATTVNFYANNSAGNNRVNITFDANNTKGVANLNHAGIVYSNAGSGATGVSLNNGGTVNVNATDAIGGTNAYVNVGTNNSDTSTTLSLMTINHGQSYGGPTMIGKTYVSGQNRTASQALLLVNNTFGSGTGDSDITVNTGTLGGKGYIVNTGAKGVTLNSHGVLSPGASAGAIGGLTMDLGTKGLNISGTGADANSQSLLFDLAAPLVSDRIALLNSTVLNIGTGVLEFDDFVFSVATPGILDSGTYTLFDSNTTIVGSLGASLTGTVGGKSATLGFANSNQDLVLTVVPEPGTLGVLAVAGMGLLTRRRRA